MSVLRRGIVETDTRGKRNTDWTETLKYSSAKEGRNCERKTCGGEGGSSLALGSGEKAGCGSTACDLMTWGIRTCYIIGTVFWGYRSLDSWLGLLPCTQERLLV